MLRSIVSELATWSLSLVTQYSFGQRDTVIAFLLVCQSVRSSDAAVFSYNSSAVAEMGDRLAIIDMGRPKSGGLLCHFFGVGSWVPIQHNVARAEAYLHTKWHLDPSTVWPQYVNVKQWVAVCMRL